jgi:hypothetical protein
MASGLTKYLKIVELILTMLFSARTEFVIDLINRKAKITVNDFQKQITAFIDNTVERFQKSTEKM